MAQIKNKKFDIIVGIPTYNEADSISNTVSKIDKGLFKYFPEYKALIVNMDSQSTDGTNRVFLNTKTKIEKITLSVNRQPRGKGANIFALLKLSKKFGAKYIATIDADITTITEKWPKLLLDPIIKNKADFVAPIYTRSRYEGNTTNHFCFPLLYAWFGYKIHQPIGGDFAFNQHFVDYILKQQKNKDAFLYGIDIFLSTHALGGNFRIQEEYLGRKIHKPSFDKIIPMFQQVAATTLFVLSKYKDKINISEPTTEIEDEQRTDSFIQKPEHAKIENLKKHAFQSLQKLPVKNIKKYLGLNLEKAKEIQKSKPLISEKEWVKILANVSKYIVEHKIGDKMADDIATTISPFFFLRVIAYFKELDKIKNQKDIDALIFKQAKELRYLFTRSSIAIDFNKEKSYSNWQYTSFKTKQQGGRGPMNTPYSVTLTAIPGIPLIKEGDDLGAIILKCASEAGITFENGDVLVVSSKIVSKAEGRLVSLASVKPSEKAREIARLSGKDPRIVELMMQESQILNVKPGVIETLHRLGFICTSGGIDRANTGKPEEEKVSLLPINPDESAQKISDAITRATGKRVGVVINDSLGIKYRVGSIGLAIGVAAIPAILKGAPDETDLYGKKRNVNISFADEIAAAGSLLMGQSNAGLPVILIRGLRYPSESGKLADLIATDQLKDDLAKKK
jgi:coenzyme F420-0:L-glutamate ligase